MLVQELMENKEIEFFEYTERPKGEDVCTSEQGPTNKVHGVSHPVLIISRPRVSKVGVPIVPKFIIQKPVAFSYKDSKRVPWNYDCNVTTPRRENPAGTSEKGQDEGFYTRSGRRYTPNTKVEPAKEKSVVVEQRREKTTRSESPVNELVTEKEAKEFLKFLKHNEYSVVEQLHKQPARISVLALLLSSKTHRSALMKVLNKTYVADDISVNKLDRLVNNISSDNFIFFNDDEIPPGGMGSTKALHITTRCKGHTLLGVLIDNGSALNVLPLSTLNRLAADSSHIKTCQNIVRAFDGTERKVMVKIEIPFLIGPNTYDVDFLVMDIKPSYNFLLGRSWIHSAGVVPSSLHQKLKLVTEGRLVTINTEEDIITFVTSDAPYVGTDNEEQDPNAQNIQNYEDGPAIDSRERSPARERTWKMPPGKDRFGLEFKPDAKQKKKELEKKQERRRARLHRTIHPKQEMTMKKVAEEMLGSLSINAISEERTEEENLSGICPYIPGSVLNNWTAEEIPVTFRINSE
ncbi:uncharacterized protein LOC108478017 [Gossypium arboreum]|uniref:uncharacterized protein LOC108478017 n=1 Tax=Gossypium arboreum TaxID=29729 RepID=UPI000818F394|nr:uncharacterized protein LOC108478017 [Gossypium arboreum]